MSEYEYFMVYNEKLSKSIDSALEFAVHYILKELGDNVISILLTGSLSRGEGVWKFYKGDPILVSDIDLFIVVEKPISNYVLNRISNEISRRTGFSFDIKFSLFELLPYLPKDTHTFDWKYSSKVLWGANVLDIFPKFSSEDIDQKDIIILFFNRILLTLKKFPIFGLYSTNSKILLSNEASKTLFTCADLIIIANGEYSPSISDKIKILRRLKNTDITSTHHTSVKSVLLKEINNAFRFRFYNEHLLYYQDAFEYWIRSKNSCF